MDLLDGLVGCYFCSVCRLSPKKFHWLHTHCNICASSVRGYCLHGYIYCNDRKPCSLRRKVHVATFLELLWTCTMLRVVGFLFGHTPWKTNFAEESSNLSKGIISEGSPMARVEMCCHTVPGDACKKPNIRLEEPRSACPEHFGSSWPITQGRVVLLVSNRACKPRCFVWTHLSVWARQCSRNVHCRMQDSTQWPIAIEYAIIRNFRPNMGSLFFVWCNHFSKTPKQNPLLPYIFSNEQTWRVLFSSQGCYLYHVRVERWIW